MSQPEAIIVDLSPVAVVAEVAQGPAGPQGEQGIQGEPGPSEHSALDGRNLADQHPILAIEGLQSALDSIQRDASTAAVGDGIADDTSAIQAALDAGGHVRLRRPGIYSVGRLVIGDDTFFDLGPEVTLKKRDGTNHYLLVNSGHLSGTRNRNIRVSGGKWDLNSAGNPQATGNLSVDPQSWSGIGILFRGVDSLAVENVIEAGGEWKYCYLICDCTDVTCDKIRFNNGSDGLHFQPPIRNLLVQNISGITLDDMVSFTMGDYNPYAIGVTGDIENVHVRNIVSAAGTHEHIKLVGAGLNGTSKFRNFRVENLRGPVSVASVTILQRDQAVSNNYLNNTYLENVVFSAIQPDLSGATAPFLISATAGDITIENTIWRTDQTTRFVQVVGGNAGKLDKLTLRNVKASDSAVRALSSFVRCDSSMLIEVLNIEDTTIYLPNVTTLYAISPTANSIKQINVSDSHLNIGASSGCLLVYSDGASAQRNAVRVVNSKLRAGRLWGGSTPVALSLSNVATDFPLTFAYMDDGGDVRLRVESSALQQSIATNITTAQRVFALSAPTAPYGGLLSYLTPEEGDMVRSANAAEPGGKGLYYYNGAAWVKLA